MNYTDGAVGLNSRVELPVLSNDPNAKVVLCSNWMHPKAVKISTDNGEGVWVDSTQLFFAILTLTDI